MSDLKMLPYTSRKMSPDTRLLLSVIQYKLHFSQLWLDLVRFELVSNRRENFSIFHF